MLSIGHLAVRHLRSFHAAAAGVIGNAEPLLHKERKQR